MFVLEQIKKYAKTNRIALINRKEVLSFQEMDARSEAFAAYLLERFGGDRTPVIIYGHKESDFLPCIYGALKSGRAYVPVEPSVPPDRATEIVADIAPKIIVDFSGKLQGDAMSINPESLTRILEHMVHDVFKNFCLDKGDSLELRNVCLINLTSYI